MKMQKVQPHRNDDRYRNSRHLDAIACLLTRITPSARSVGRLNWQLLPNGFFGNRLSNGTMAASSAAAVYRCIDGKRHQRADSFCSKPHHTYAAVPGISVKRELLVR